ncbi:MAG: peptide-methionine (S)-S-oxide reductase MsrA [Chlorobia bacterium]|nr:peptide-methionine (S)-S-oxide reductase MsrA [Fimbriimonadaceae bacterium]
MIEIEGNRETATLAAGCFWGVEFEFAKMDGVLKTKVGYTGGTTSLPGYHDVCDGDTGHAEAIEIEFDSGVISFGQIVEEFFNLHDPTTLNRQGPDVGDQYRSAIFYHSDEQKEIAQGIIAKLTKDGEFDRPIVTQLVPAGPFWDAEEYHQQYFAKRGMASCHIRRK